MVEASPLVRLEVKPHVQTYGVLSLGLECLIKETGNASLEITRKYAAAHLAIGPCLIGPDIIWI